MGIWGAFDCSGVLIKVVDHLPFIVLVVSYMFCNTTNQKIHSLCVLGPGGPSWAYGGPSDSLRVLIKDHCFITFWWFAECFVKQQLTKYCLLFLGGLGGPSWAYWGGPYHKLWWPDGSNKIQKLLPYYILMISLRFCKATFGVNLIIMPGAYRRPPRGPPALRL